MGELLDHALSYINSSSKKFDMSFACNHSILPPIPPVQKTPPPSRLADMLGRTTLHRPGARAHNLNACMATRATYNTNIVIP